jgi:hypothetical protein
MRASLDTSALAEAARVDPPYKAARRGFFDGPISFCHQAGHSNRLAKEAV